jgi:hypothetical protein
MLLFIPALIFLLLSSCSTMPAPKYDYVVTTPAGTFICDKLEYSPYGAAALDCEHVLLEYKVASIPNPTVVHRIKE